MKPGATIDPATKAPLTNRVFPGRHLLTVGEVATACGVDNQHITNLVESGDLVAIDLRTSRPARPGTVKHKSTRQLLRIPTSALDALIARRTTV